MKLKKDEQNINAEGGVNDKLKIKIDKKKNPTLDIKFKTSDGIGCKFDKIDPVICNVTQTQLKGPRK